MNKYISQIIIILLVIGGLYLLLSNIKESFSDVVGKEDLLRNKMGVSVRHVKLNDWGGVDYVDQMPPYWRNEHGCYQFPCPSVFDENVVCWKCMWRYSQPNNE